MQVVAFITKHRILLGVILSAVDTDQCSKVKLVHPLLIFVDPFAPLFFCLWWLEVLILQMLNVDFREGFLEILVDLVVNAVISTWAICIIWIRTILLSSFLLLISLSPGQAELARVYGRNQLEVGLCVVHGLINRSVWHNWQDIYILFVNTLSWLIFSIFVCDTYNSSTLCLPWQPIAFLLLLLLAASMLMHSRILK